MTYWTQWVGLSERVLLDSGIIWAEPGWDLLQIWADQFIWVSKKMSMSYEFYKSAEEKSGDKWD